MNKGLTRIVPIALFGLGTGASALELDTRQVTLSGLSSGGYMANQLHMAYAERVKGVGIIAAGPYYCSQGAILTALDNCTGKQDGQIDEAELLSVIARRRAEGQLAPVSAITDDKVWLFSGGLDTTVRSEVTKALERQYQQWLADDNIKWVSFDAAHHFPTKDKGSPCERSLPPYLGNCGFDAAADMLSHLLSDARAPADSPKGTLVSLGQRALAGPSGDGLGDTAYAFVPDECLANKRCELHVSLHGCNQNSETVQQAYVTRTGLNEMASTNGLVVLYPQTKNSTLFPLNPQGCWDWWGYSGDNFATRQGTQLRAIIHMIDQLPATLARTLTQ